MTRPHLHLNGLRAFEATARHRSVKEAALELGVTPSAVSHQIRQLEALLGVRLFEKDGRGSILTEDGARLLPKLTQGLSLLKEALEDHFARTKAGPLRISVLETFALYWLMPRLNAYPFGRDGFGLRITASQRVVSFDTENMDAAVRLGHGGWEGLESEKLFDEHIGIFASPRALASNPHAPVFLSTHRISDWERVRPMLSPELARAPRMDIESVSLAIKAAVDGAGYCLAGQEMVQAEIASGLLVNVMKRAVPSARGGYWLVYPARAKRDRRLRNFRGWLFDRIAETEPAERSASSSTQI
jgi:LysR family transcriptional regulator, glycine cleavage system transcriptional activator